MMNSVLCPSIVGAALNTKKSSSAIAQYCNLSLIFFLLAKTRDPATLKIANELVCLQMIISEPIDIPIIDTIIELEERNREDLLELVKLVYPEYFKSKTATLGNYYGIYKDDQLVAVTGERMQMVILLKSAVITHPDYLGKDMQNSW
jgi:hypothetical protein